MALTPCVTLQFFCGNIPRNCAKTDFKLNPVIPPEEGSGVTSVQQIPTLLDVALKEVLEGANRAWPLELEATLVLLREELDSGEAADLGL